MVIYQSFSVKMSSVCYVRDIKYYQSAIGLLIFVLNITRSWTEFFAVILSQSQVLKYLGQCRTVPHRQMSCVTSLPIVFYNMHN